MTGKMTGPELAAVESQIDMLNLHCPLHMIKLFKSQCSLWHDRQDDRVRAGGRQKPD